MSFARGYQQFRRTDITPLESYQSLRKLYCLTNGRFNDAASWFLSRLHPASELVSAESILGECSEDSVQRIVENIETNGFHVFDRKLPSGTVRALRGFAETIPCRAILTSGLKLGEYADKLAPYSEHPVESPKYDIAQHHILGNSTVQQLLMDSGLHCVAQRFLRCAPILDVVAMWWIRPFHGKASTEAAQLYHFDMDRIKFLKFFFYLTDVTLESGPHCYVRGSSKRKPAAILRDGRISDEEICRHYPPEDIVEICGERGSIIAVDTRGWHKGKPLIQGERLLLQFEFANSMFGQNYPKIDFPEDASPSFRSFAHEHSNMFQGIFTQLSRDRFKPREKKIAGLLRSLLNGTSIPERK
jgi:Phytanoyl-CoA dioxygenase (PhyH)